MEKSKFIKVIGLIFIILLVIVSISYAYIKLDILKTPSQLFGKYFLNGIMEVSEINAEPYSEIFERIKKEKVEITSKQEIEYNNNLLSGYYNNLETESTNEIQKIVVNEIMKLDMPNKNMEYLMDAKNNGKDFFKVSFIKTDNTYGFFNPELHDKYLAIENRDFKKIAKTFGATDEIVEYIPNELPKMHFSEEEKAKMKELFLKYINKISDNIDSKSYTKEKYSMINLDGKNITGNKYVLTITEDRFKEIFENIYLELEKDQEFLNAIEGNVLELYVDYIKLLRDFSNTMSSSILDAAQNASSNIEENNFAEEINEVDKIPKNNNIRLCLYEHKGNTVKFEILDEDENAIDLSINKNKTSTNIRFRTYTPKTEYSKVSSENILDFLNKYENNKGELILSAQTRYNKEDIENLKRENNEENSYFADYYNDEYYALRYPDTDTSLKIITNVNKDIVNIKLEFDTNTKKNANQKFDLTLKYNPELKLTLLNKENTIVVNDFTMEEFLELGTELTNNLKKSAEENSETLIGTYIKQKEEEERKNIEYYKERVKEDIKESIEYNLEEYHYDLRFDENVNPGDYLTLEKIKEEAGWIIDEMELIDGTTLKCTVNDYVYFAKINIDGNEWKLIDVEVLYSEDGTLENAV